MFHVIEIPSNANTIFAGRVVFTGSKIEAENEAASLHHKMQKEVAQAQAVANRIAYPGVAATHIAPSEYGVISENEWNAEFERRNNR